MRTSASLADAPGERRVDAIDELPPLRFKRLPVNPRRPLDRQGVRYADLFQGRTARVEGHHHRP